MLELEPKRSTRKEILANWFDDHLSSLDPGVDEIAQLILNELLEEHSCCDSQTWHIKDDELYRKILHAPK